MKDGSATFAVHPIQLPGGNAKEWRELWRPCAAQRLFLPVRVRAQAQTSSSLWWIREGTQLLIALVVLRRGRGPEAQRANLLLPLGIIW